MLALLFGPSCVGKSTVISVLRAGGGWRTVPTYTTRPLRKCEADKLSVSHGEFEYMELHGAFLGVNNFYGNRYGTPLAEIKHAVEATSEKWIMDYPYAKREVFSELTHVGFILMPANSEQLEEQIHASGRADRLRLIVDEYDKLVIEQSSRGLDYPIIVNGPGEAVCAAASIEEHVKSLWQF